jgi:hypothetical protein
MDRARDRFKRHALASAALAMDFVATVELPPGLDTRQAREHKAERIMRGLPQLLTRHHRPEARLLLDPAERELGQVGQATQECPGR